MTQDNNANKTLLEYILEVDALTTTEFCEKFSVPMPVLTANVNASVDNLLQIDAIKHRLFVEYAKKIARAPKPTDNAGQVTAEERFNTNSEIGSHHWFQTLMGQAIRSNEFISLNPTHEKVSELSKKSMEILLFIAKHHRKINNP